jgi:hypothetical protein
MKKIVLLAIGLMLFMISLTPSLALEEKTIRMLAIEMRENKIENQSIINEIKQIRLSIRTELKQIREEDITIDPDTLTLIEQLMNDIREIRTSILSTKGNIMELQENARPLIKQREWDEVRAIYEQIIDIQETRNEELFRLLEKMNQVYELVKNIL